MLGAFITDHDASDSAYVCYRAQALTDAGRLAYWTWKFLKIIKLPPPE